MPPKLPIHHWEFREVLFPGEGGETEQGIAVVLEGGPFPVRALEPEIHVGDQRAELVQVLDGGARIRGIIRARPQLRDYIVVRYDPETSGRTWIDEEFEIQPLPKGC